MNINSKERFAFNRFSNRAENYAKYRPSYPASIIFFLEEKFKLEKDCRIADIGSGTGLFTEMFLKKGYEVVGIEPNEEMRVAGEERLQKYTGFTSRNRQAESTGLRTGSVDLITVAQAFHWLDEDAAKKEFNRILKPGGHIVLGWNVRKTDTRFLEAYELLKQEFGIEYVPGAKINEEAIRRFIHPGQVQSIVFPNTQWLDFDGLKGQLLSSSYIPLPGHRSYDTMISSLVSLFVHYNESGFVRMDYDTKLYWNG